MVRKTSLIILLLMVLVLAGSAWAEKLYEANFINKTGLIADVAVVEILEDDSEVLRFSFMLGPDEAVKEMLPAGHYHVIASCVKGYLFLCIIIPDSLKHPDRPVNIFFRGEAKEV